MIARPKPARPQSLLLADERVLQRIVLGIVDRGVRQLADVEALARVGDAVQQHAPRADARDAHLARGIELAAPLDGVEEQLAERLPDRLAHGFAAGRLRAAS